MAWLFRYQAARLNCQTTGQRATHREAHLKPLGERSATGGPQTFFRKASDNMYLSSERSVSIASAKRSLFQLPQPPEFAHAQMGILLLPRIEGGLGNPVLSAEIADRSAGLSLSEGIDDLLLSES